MAQMAEHSLTPMLASQGCLIDLTNDDDEDESTARFPANPAFAARPFGFPAPAHSSPQPAYYAPSLPHYDAPPYPPRPPPANVSLSAYPSHSTHLTLPAPLPARAVFPHDPSPAHPEPRPVTQQLAHSYDSHSVPATNSPPQPPAPAGITPTSTVIDLTSSRSPSPVPVPFLGQLQAQPSSHMDALANGFATLNPGSSQTPLPDSMHPKAPVCIGQLNVTALVLYPTQYLQSSPGVIHELDWAPVRLQYDRNPNRPGSEDTIHIRTPPSMDLSNPGENFGVVEQKVAVVLGPMLYRGLVRLEARVKRGMPNVPILPLEALVFTPKGNIPVVGTYLSSKNLLLDHPRPHSYNLPYFNPHNPPPGGWGHSAAGSTYQNRWVGQVPAKSVEVQRSQVETLFKNLQAGGDELPECEAPSNISTSLYPHQKKALTFLLEREGDFVCKDGKSSLWEERTDPISRVKSWYHLVTQREVAEQPRDCRGSILADDMGLGKTITCVSLIAATLHSAYGFEQLPLQTPSPPPMPSAPASSSAATTSLIDNIWSTVLTPKSSSKGKAKEAKAFDIAQSRFIRACRIKARSRATLIVCPLSTVANWEEQFREHWRGKVVITGGSGPCSVAAELDGTKSFAAKDGESTNGNVSRNETPLRVYVYHGNSRRSDPLFLANFDVVVTTFSTLASEYSKQSRSIRGDDEGSCESELDTCNPDATPGTKKSAKRKRAIGNGTEITSPLQSVHWFRVVLDEAHSIKEISTVACRASCDLMAERRLCLTGTPVQNKLDDIFALIKFLRLEPLDDKNTWTEFVGSPVKYGQPLGVARLQTIMKCITLRRTKESKTSTGERILSLPPRRDELRYLKFNPEEQSIYDRFYNESQAEFKELSHKNEVMKNYVGILQKILRLRQICDHIDLVKGKGLYDEQGFAHEELTSAILNEGLTVARAAAVFALLREAATAQCTECGYELASCGVDVSDSGPHLDPEPSMPATPAKRAVKKAKNTPSRGPTRASSPTQATQAVLTRCQHLFCICCFRRGYNSAWPQCPNDHTRPCPECQANLHPTDAVIVDTNYVAPSTREAPTGRVTVKEEMRREITSLQELHSSTKIKALLGDLFEFSRANPHSANYNPESLEVQMMDNKGNIDGVTKTIVFSQWTSMLDKVEDALIYSNIRFDRLDGTMKREDRSRAINALKIDPACEVLLVSLRAGGVGLNLTAAQRVYLMDPYWNPAVENQAVDRIHRLGQTKPVVTVKLIIEGSIEDKLLRVQRKKMDLANMTLGQKTLTKEQLSQRRLEELHQLFN